MNGRLLTLAVLVVVAGLLSGLVPLIFLGVILTLPALFLRGNRRGMEQPRVETASAGQSAGRDEPAETTRQAPAEAERPLEPPAPVNFGTAAPPLFPYPVLPTLNPVKPTDGAQQEHKGEENELVELALLLGLNWMASRRKR